MTKTKSTKKKKSIDLDEFFDNSVNLELEGVSEEDVKTWTEAAKAARFISV